jgi:hypothetical protein
MLASNLQRWVAEKNDWARMLRVDAMVPCMNVQLVFQSAPNCLCTPGTRQKGWTHDASGLSCVFVNRGS